MHLSAQEPKENETNNEVEVGIAADVISKYIWRGMQSGDVSIQPVFDLSWKGFALQVSGNTGLVKADDPNEIDISASFTKGGFTVGVIDYWNDFPETRYFIYDAHSTSHVFEAFAGYDFGPVNATWYTNFGGNDGLNKSGKRAYSSYVELNAPFKLAQFDWTATLGMVPYATSFYEVENFSATNISLAASKEINVTDHFTIPFFAQFTANTASKNMYFIFGLRLHP